MGGEQLGVGLAGGRGAADGPGALLGADGPYLQGILGALHAHCGELDGGLLSQVGLHREVQRWAPARGDVALIHIAYHQGLAQGLLHAHGQPGVEVGQQVAAGLVP